MENQSETILVNVRDAMAASVTTSNIARVPNFIATPQLRIAVPKGTHMPSEQRLQQLWVDPHTNQREWRNIPTTVVEASELASK